MRRSPFRALAVSLLLVSSLASVSAFALDRDAFRDRDRDLPTFSRLLKKVVKKIVRTLEDTMSVPKP